MAKKLSDIFPYEEYLMIIEKIADYVIGNNASTREVANYFSSNGIKISYVTVSNLLNSNEFQENFPSKYEMVQNILKSKSTIKMVNNIDTLVRVQKAVDLALRGYTVAEIASMLNSTESIIYKDLTSRLKRLDNEELAFLVNGELEEHRFNNLKNVSKK